MSYNRNHQQNQQNQPEYVLFIGGLSPQVTNKDLIDYFRQFGYIVRAKIIADKKTKIPKGYAYVTCKGKETFDLILSQTHQVVNRDVDVQQAHSGAKIATDIKNQMIHKICIKNLTESTNQKDLQDHFTQYGKIKHAYVIMDHETQRSKRFGYIEFINDLDCEKALKDKHFICGNEIDCERFIPKAVKKAGKKIEDHMKMEDKSKQMQFNPGHWEDPKEVEHHQFREKKGSEYIDEFRLKMLEQGLSQSPEKSANKKKKQKKAKSGKKGVGFGDHTSSSMSEDKISGVNIVKPDNIDNNLIELSHKKALMSKKAEFDMKNSANVIPSIESFEKLEMNKQQFEGGSNPVISINKKLPKSGVFVDSNKKDHIYSHYKPQGSYQL